MATGHLLGQARKCALPPDGSCVGLCESGRKGGYIKYWAECLACNGDGPAEKHFHMSPRPVRTAEWALLHGNCR